MKGANPQKKIFPIEKTISQDFILDMKPAIYSSNMLSGFVTTSLEVSELSSDYVV